MGATAFIVLIVIGIIAIMNAAMNTALKKHHFQKPHIFLWMLLGVGVGFLLMLLPSVFPIPNNLPVDLSNLLTDWIMSFIGSGYFVAGLFFAICGIKKAYKYYIALSSFFFGYSVWFLLLGITGLFAMY